MSTTESITKLFKRLWSHFLPRRKKQVGYLFFLMLAASGAEIISIGAVVPFLGVLTEPEHIYNNPNARSFIELLNISSPEKLLFPLTIIFILAALIAGSMRLLLLWVTTRFSLAAGADLSFNIYRRTLYQPYMVHISRNTSEIINGISKKVDSVIISTILPSLNLMSSIILIISILIVLLIIDPFIALASICGFGSLYLLITFFTRKRLFLNGETIANESTNVIKSLQEGLGGIRDILIDGTQETYCKQYRDADLKLRYAQGNNIFISQSPRFAMESLGILLIAVLAYALTVHSTDVKMVIPVLGAMALGAQRLLPLMQRAFWAWSNIQGGLASLVDTLELLEQSQPDDESLDIAPVAFYESILLKNLSFRYGLDKPWVIRNLNLKITKGSRVGIIGTTGSGKSTLVDIIMGLLQPTEGIFEVDGQPVTTENMRNWQVHIAHVPQSIYLADSTIEENIAFGVPKNSINKERVKCAAEQAQISELIESWPDSYQTFVGERGIRLSGGQRQRIGIARALYKHADVIIFDEATSALDNETEQSVMQSIDSLSSDLTVIIIAHRLSTLKNCTQIIDLGKLADNLMNNAKG